MREGEDTISEPRNRIRQKREPNPDTETPKYKTQDTVDRSIDRSIGQHSALLGERARAAASLAPLVRANAFPLFAQLDLLVFSLQSEAEPRVESSEVESSRRAQEYAYGTRTRSLPLGRERERWEREDWSWAALVTRNLLFFRSA